MMVKLKKEKSPHFLHFIKIACLEAKTKAKFIHSDNSFRATLLLRYKPWHVNTININFVFKGLTLRLILENAF